MAAASTFPIALPLFLDCICCFVLLRRFVVAYRTDAFELSCALSTGLSRNDVAMILTLTEAGINAQAIAEVVKTLRAQQAALVRRHRRS